MRVERRRDKYDGWVRIFKTRITPYVLLPAEIADAVQDAMHEVEMLVDQDATPMFFLGVKVDRAKRKKNGSSGGNRLGIVVTYAEVE